jgi:hypothetical protein
VTLADAIDTLRDFAKRHRPTYGTTCHAISVVLAAIENTEVNAAIATMAAERRPCVRCGQCHPLDEFILGSRVTVTKDGRYPGVVRIGDAGTVIGWSNIGVPVYSVELLNGRQLNFAPCELLRA